MQSRSAPKLRLLWAILALLQLSAATVVPIADALLEGGVERVAHIESEAGADCVVVHDHLFCQLCRVVGLAGRHSEPVHGPEWIATIGSFTVPSSLDVRPASPGHCLPVGSRAPPRA